MVMEQAPVLLILVAVYVALVVHQLLLGLLMQLLPSKCEMSCAVDDRQRSQVSASAAQCNTPAVPGLSGDFQWKATASFHHLAEQARGQQANASPCCMLCMLCLAPTCPSCTCS